MFQTLKKTLFSSNTATNALKKWKVDKSNELITQKGLQNIIKIFRNKDKKSQMIQALSQKMKDTNVTQRIKTLVILQKCLRQGFDKRIISLIEGTQVINTVKFKNQVDQYLEQNLVKFYSVYLKKICLNRQSYAFIKQLCTHEQQYKDKKIQITSHGFKIINLMNFIRSSKVIFQKMGRYHIDRQQVINVFLEILQDLDYYNLFITKAANIILSKDQNQNQSKNIDKESQIQDIDDIDLYPSYFDTQTQQEIRHDFLFITQAQNACDYLLNFFQNQYFYKTVTTVFKIPDFFSVNHVQYEDLRKKAKLVDKNMVRMVKYYKYEGTYRQLATKTSRSNENLTQFFSQRADPNILKKRKASFLFQDISHTCQNQRSKHYNG